MSESNSDVIDGAFFIVERPLRLVFLHALVFLYRFGGDGRGCFALRGVGLLNVSCGCGDGTPSLATTDADSDSSEERDAE